MRTPLFSRLRWLGFWLSLLLASSALQAQSPSVDSLRRVLVSPRADSTRVRLLQLLVEKEPRPDDLQQLVALLQRLQLPQHKAYRLWLATTSVHWPFQHYSPVVLQNTLDSLQAAVREFDRLGRWMPTLYYNIATLYTVLNQPAAAQAYLRRQLAFYQQRPTRWGRSIEACLFFLGESFEEQGDYNQAIGYYLQTLEAAKRYRTHPSAPLEGYYYDLIGSTYAKWGNQAKAQAYYQRALRAYPAAGNLAPSTLYSLIELESSLATAYARQRQGAAAWRVVEGALRQQARLAQQVTPENAYSYALQAAQLLVLKSSLLLDQHQPAAAGPLLQQAQGLVRANHLDTVNHLQSAHVWARYYTQRGQLAAAAAAWCRAYQLARLTRHPNEALADARQLAQVYQAQHQPARAAPYALIALQLADSLAARQGSALVARYEIVQADRAQAARLAQANQRQRQAVAQAQAQRRALLYTGAGVVGLLLLASALYAAFRRSRRLARLVTAQRDQLDTSLTDLRITQTQLIQQEKMASLGELTAGIAHEIQNPLNFVNNFADVSAELVGELRQELTKGDLAEAHALADDLEQNLQKIHQHGSRASGIVRGMLAHSRASTGERQLADVNRLSEEYWRLAYHGLRAKDQAFKADLQTDFAAALPLVEAVPGDLGRVLLNLFTNAFYAVQQRQRAGESGYVPTVRVRTRQIEQQVQIQVQDNGTGMSAEVQAKVFQPFFTTKPTGEGTGLGLSLSYDIITQGHGGTLTVASEPGQGSIFTISLPLV